jgi:hypothetical protein
VLRFAETGGDAGLADEADAVPDDAVVAGTGAGGSDALGADATAEGAAACTTSPAVVVTVGADVSSDRVLAADEFSAATGRRRRATTAPIAVIATSMPARIART